MSIKEKGCKWNFADQPEASQDVGPNNAMEQTFRQDPYDSLVRESIQNSLDAVDDDSKPVIVKYEWKQISFDEFPAFFELATHIDGCLKYYPDNANAKAQFGPMKTFFEKKGLKEIGYLRVSDYNTIGMNYDKANHKGSFYAFVRSAGVSDKKNTSAGGSFGFGKAAYFLLSPISTIMVSTCSKEGQHLFEGESSLCTHDFNGQKKMAIGYYDNQNGGPIFQDENIPGEFLRTKSGTNIDIMGVEFSDYTENFEEMAKSVLRNFWLAIYRNKLVVQIGNDFSVDQSNIFQVMEKFYPSEKDEAKKFRNDLNPRPYLEAVHNAEKSAKYKCFKEKLEILGDVVLYTNLCGNDRDKVVKMRKPLMMIEGKKYASSLGLCGVFVCSDSEGNEILRQMEPSSHNAWDADNWKENNRTVKKGRDALKELDDFLRRCLDSFLANKKSESINIKGLENYLYIPTEWEDSLSEQEALTGEASDDTKDDGNSPTNVLSDGENPLKSNTTDNSSVGKVFIKKTANANPAVGGNLQSGQGQNKVKSKGGNPRSSNPSSSNQETENGKEGAYSYSITIPYRSFSQIENGGTIHYVVLHSTESLGNIRLRFKAAGDENDVPLSIKNCNIGRIVKNELHDIRVDQETTRLRIQFTDGMKHSLKIEAEKVNEN